MAGRRSKGRLKLLPEADLPAGRLTFLLTDLEGSTRLWETEPAAMKRALGRHNAIVEAGIERHTGTVVRSRGEGDSFFAFFERAADAIAAAGSIQFALQHEAWPGALPIRARMSVYTGQAERGDWPLVLNRCARLRGVASGGQVLVSAATEELVRDVLEDGVELVDMGAQQLRDLVRPERVFQLAQPGLNRDFPALPAADHSLHNLPLQLTSFIGRESEIAELKAILARARLITLTGTGGCGKTRLAMQLAAEMMTDYPDGVWLVELAPLSDPGLLPQALASAVRSREEAARPLVETLKTDLKPRRTLVVLDNCEHLVEACARLADELLGSCPDLRLLATSRESLNVSGEISWRVPSLSMPAPVRSPKADQLIQSEAVRLFLDRGRMVVPGFCLTDRNVPAVADICRRLDGIPLAIELAAARLNVLSPEEIVKRLADRFRLLTGGRRTAMPRQQTLRAAVDWSHDLLGEPERCLLRRLAVFASGFELAAAEAVCAGEGLDASDVLPLLAKVVDKSLVLAGTGEAGDRYQLTETLRQYALERLVRSGEADSVRDRHASTYLDLAEKAQSQLRGPDQRSWLERLETEHDNLRVGLEWSLDRVGETAIRMAAAMAPFWQVRGYLQEGRSWCEKAVERSSDDSPARGQALLGCGVLALRQGDLAAARSHCQQSLDWARRRHDQTAVAKALSTLSVVALDDQDLAASAALLEEGLEIFRQMGDWAGIGMTLNNLGLVTLTRGDISGARAHLEECLAIERRLDDRWRLATVLMNLGLAALGAKDYEDAVEKLRESLIIFRDLKDNMMMPMCLEICAALAASNSQPERALRLAGAAASLRALGGAVGPASFQSWLSQALDPARRDLGSEAGSTAWDQGAAMPLERAIDEALAIDPH